MMPRYYNETGRRLCNGQLWPMPHA